MPNTWKLKLFPKTQGMRGVLPKHTEHRMGHQWLNSSGHPTAKVGDSLEVTFVFPGWFDGSDIGFRYVGLGLFGDVPGPSDQFHVLNDPTSDLVPYGWNANPAQGWTSAQWSTTLEKATGHEPYKFTAAVFLLDVDASSIGGPEGPYQNYTYKDPDPEMVVEDDDGDVLID